MCGPRGHNHIISIHTPCGTLFREGLFADAARWTIASTSTRRSLEGRDGEHLLPGVALFDRAAACPSLQWRWVLRTLGAQGVLGWVRLLVRGLLVGSTAVVVHGGSPASGAIAFTRGVPVLVHCGLWPSLRFCSMLRVIGGSLGAFAGDMSAAMLDMVRGMHRLTPALAKMKPAAGLMLSLSDTSIMNCGAISDGGLQRSPRVGFGLDGVTVVQEGVSLGFVLGLEHGDAVWTSVLRKDLSRIVLVREAPGFTGDRMEKRARPSEALGAPEQHEALDVDITSPLGEAAWRKATLATVPEAEDAEKSAARKRAEERAQQDAEVAEPMSSSSSSSSSGSSTSGSSSSSGEGEERCGNHPGIRRLLQDLPKGASRGGGLAHKRLRSPSSKYHIACSHLLRFPTTPPDRSLSPCQAHWLADFQQCAMPAVKNLRDRRPGS